MTVRRTAGLMLGLATILIGHSVLADTPGWRPLKIDGHTVRWQRPADADGKLRLRWRLVAASETFDGAVNCQRMVPTSAMLSASRVSVSSFRAELSAAFAMWQRASGLSFVEAEAGERADIVIGAQSDPTGRAYADVAYDHAGTGPERGITRSLICLNPRMRWKIGFDGNLDVYDLRYTLAHEIGHAIGLDHPSERGSLMWFRYDERVSGLQRDDIAGAEALYGTHGSAPATIGAHAPDLPAEGRKFGLR